MRSFSRAVLFIFAATCSAAVAAPDPFGDISDLKLASPDDKVDVPTVPPPKDAKVLFDGKTLDNWVQRNGKDKANWKLLDGGILEVASPTADIITRDAFDGSFKLHVEFRVGYQPQAKGQRRGNSGVYLQGRYEVQVLDSYGLTSKFDDCGGIYSVAAPLKNVCKAPTIWQSFDIEFHAPRCKDGKRVEPALMTVHHNGVKIHDDVKITIDNSVRGLGGDVCKPGPILLQENGCPVQYRNIWLVKIEPAAPAATTAPATTPKPTPPAKPDPTPAKPKAEAPAASGAFTWTTVTASPIPRVESPAAVIGNKLYLFGGFTHGLVPSPRLDVYDAAGDTWTRLKDLPTDATHLNPAVAGNTVWFAGGFKGRHPGKATDEVWKYDIAADAWEKGPPLPEPRAAGALAAAGKELHYFGGFKADRDTTMGSHWVLSLDGGTEWKAAADMPDPRGHLSVAVVDGRIYALGGQLRHDSNPIDLTACHVFDPATGKWSAIAPLSAPRSHFEPGTLVHNGKIIIVGGRANSAKPSRGAVNNVTEYDPKTDAWTELGTIPANLLAPAAVIVGDKLVVTCGGLNTTTPPQATTRIATLPKASAR